MDFSSLGQGWLDRLKTGFGSRQELAVGYNPRFPIARIALVIMLAFSLLAPIMTFGGVNLTEEGSVERQVAYIIVLGLSIYSALPVATRTSIFAIPIPVVLALVWCWLSMAWSLDIGNSFRRVVLTTIVIWSIYILVRHNPYRQVVDVIRWVLVAAVLVSYAIVFVNPTVGIHTMLESNVPTALIGNWRGFLGHKNFAGAVCALCMILFVFDAKRYPAVLRIAIFVVVGYFLFRSQSKTSAGMLVMAIAGGFAFQLLGRSVRAYLIPLITLFCVLFWGLTSFYSDVIRSNLLDPASFTGRGQIWAALLAYARDNPLTGAGFGSFWNIGTASPIYTYGRGYVTTITVGHSGYLDQLVAVGVPGLLLMVFAVVVSPMAKLLTSKTMAPERGALIMAMLIFCIGHNVTESGLFERDAIVSTFLFLAAALAQYAGASERRGASSEAAADLFRALRERRKTTLPVAEA